MCDSSVVLLVEADNRRLDSLQIPVILVLPGGLWTEIEVVVRAPEDLAVNWEEAESDWNVLRHAAAAACTELHLGPNCFLLTEVSKFGFRSGFCLRSPHASDVLGHTHEALEEVRLSMDEENKEDFGLVEEAGTTRVVMKVSWRAGTDALRPDTPFLESLTWVLTINSLFKELVEPLRVEE